MEDTASPSSVSTKHQEIQGNELPGQRPGSRPTSAAEAGPAVVNSPPLNDGDASLGLTSAAGAAAALQPRSGSEAGEESDADRDKGARTRAPESPHPSPAPGSPACEITAELPEESTEGPVTRIASSAVRDIAGSRGILQSPFAINPQDIGQSPESAMHDSHVPKPDFWDAWEAAPGSVPTSLAAMRMAKTTSSVAGKLMPKFTAVIRPGDKVQPEPCRLVVPDDWRVSDAKAWHPASAAEADPYNLSPFGVSVLSRRASDAHSEADLRPAPGRPQAPEEEEALQGLSLWPRRRLRRPQSEPVSAGVQSEPLPVEGRVHAGSLFELGISWPLWTDCKHTLTPGQELPRACGGEKAILSFVAASEHFNVRRPDYIRAVFTMCMRVVVLLPTTNPIPQWLLRDFNPLPDSEAHVEVTWRFPWPWSALIRVDSRLARLATARLSVWERKALCESGTEYCFGGTEGSIPNEDLTYLLAWYPVPRQQDNLRSPTNKGGETGDHTTAGAGQQVDYSLLGLEHDQYDQYDPHTLMQHVIHAVHSSEVAHLQQALSLYMICFRQAAATGVLWPAPSFRTNDGQLLTREAVDRTARGSRVELDIVLYLVSEGAEMDREVFRFVVNNSAAIVPRGDHGYKDLRHFVLSYVAQQRNPIASAMAMAKVLSERADEERAQAKVWRKLADVLRGIAVQLADKLELMAQQPKPRESAAAAAAPDASGTREGAAASEGGDAGCSTPVAPAVSTLSSSAFAAAIGRTLNPRQCGDSDGRRWDDNAPINDANPLEIAYVTTDLDFVSAPVVQSYLRDRWLGLDYMAQALEETGFVFSEKDNRRLLRLMEDLGFVGPLGRPAMRLLSEVFHTLVFASRAFFDSPRGRWVFQLVMEGFFLYIYHSVQMKRDEVALSWQQVVFTLYVFGMAVDELMELRHQYRGRVLDYLSSGVHLVDLACLLMLTACIGLKVAMWCLPGGQDNAVWDDLLAAKVTMYNAASVLVWGRLLPYLIPLNRGVGSNLMVMKEMFWELIGFAVIYLFLLTGITFAIYAMFRDRDIPTLASFPYVMLGLFRTFLGETLFDLFPEDPDLLYNLYGSIMTVLYVLIATVVLANLLIALMTKNFHSDKLASQSRFEMAMILERYQHQVDKHLLPAPFSLPLLLLKGASGTRPRASRWWLVLMPPPDGPALAAASAGTGVAPEAGCSRTGGDELPYVVYLLVVYPLMLVLSWALYFGMAPYCVLHFTFIGYTTLSRIFSPSVTHKPRNRRWKSALRGDRAGDGGDDELGGRGGDGAPATSRLRRPSAPSAVLPITRGLLRRPVSSDQDAPTPLLRRSSSGDQEAAGGLPRFRLASHLPESPAAEAPGVSASSASAAPTWANRQRRPRGGAGSGSEALLTPTVGATGPVAEAKEDGAAAAPPPPLVPPPMALHQAPQGEMEPADVPAQRGRRSPAAQPTPFASRASATPSAAAGRSSPLLPPPPPTPPPPPPPEVQAADAEESASSESSREMAPAFPEMRPASRLVSRQASPRATAAGTASAAPNALRRPPELVEIEAGPPDESEAAEGLTPRPNQPSPGALPGAVATAGAVHHLEASAGPAGGPAAAGGGGGDGGAGPPGAVVSSATVRVDSAPLAVNLPQLDTEPGSPTDGAAARPAGVRPLPPLLSLPSPLRPQSAESPPRWQGTQAPETAAPTPRPLRWDAMSSEARADKPENDWRALRASYYVCSRPLFLVLGAAVYLVLGRLVLVLWLGALVWPGKICFHAVWVVAGQLQQSQALGRRVTQELRKSVATSPPRGQKIHFARRRRRMRFGADSGREDGRDGGNGDGDVDANGSRDDHATAARLRDGRDDEDGRLRQNVRLSRWVDAPPGPELEAEREAVEPSEMVAAAAAAAAGGDQVFSTDALLEALQAAGVPQREARQLIEDRHAPEEAAELPAKDISPRTVVLTAEPPPSELLPQVTPTEVLPQAAPQKELPQVALRTRRMPQGVSKGTTSLGPSSGLTASSMMPAAASVPAAESNAPAAAVAAATRGSEPEPKDPFTAANFASAAGASSSMAAASLQRMQVGVSFRTTQMLRQMGY